MAPPNNFEFIVQGQEVFKDGFSKETRTRIRKQAMKKIGAERRKLGDYGKQNLRQCPVVVDEVIYDPLPSAAPVGGPGGASSDDADDADAADAADAYPRLVPGAAARSWPKTAKVIVPAPMLASPGPNQPRRAKKTSTRADHQRPGPLTANLTGADLCKVIATPMPLSGMDRLVAEYGINPVHLSSLTNVHLGGIATMVLTSKPGALVDLLSSHHPSYFSHVPSRFGRHKFLDDAVRVLVAKVKAVVAPNEANDKVVLHYYGRALQSLQTAVQDPDTRKSSDVIGATTILSVFELLNCSTSQAWSAHISGAGRLIQLRGPDAIKSDYDKDLLISLAGPLVCEALINNSKCFLGSPQWEHALFKAAKDDAPFTLRSRLGVYLTSRMAKLPGLFNDVTHAAICQRDTISPYAVQDLINRGLDLKKQMLDCRPVFDAMTPAEIDRLPDKTAMYELLGLTLTVSVLICRLIGALWGEKREEIEDEAAQLSKDLLKIDDDISPESIKVSFYLTQKGYICKSIQGTESMWRAQPGEEPAPGIIHKWKYENWCSSIPRKMCDGKQCQRPSEMSPGPAAFETSAGSETSGASPRSGSSAGISSPGSSGSPGSGLSTESVATPESV